VLPLNYPIGVRGSFFQPSAIVFPAECDTQAMGGGRMAPYRKVICKVILPAMSAYDQKIMYAWYMAYVVSIANNKGGTGKSTTTINLADGIAREGKAVLVVDADFISSSVSQWGNVQPDREKRFEVIAWRTPNLAQGLPKLLNHSHYDYVIIDCPPGGVDKEGGLMTRSALWTSHMLILPASPSGMDYWATEPMKQLVRELNAISPTPLTARWLINRKNANTRLGRAAREGAVDYAEDIPLFKTEITQRASIAESLTMGLTIYDFEPGGLAAYEYNKLVEETMVCLESSQNPSLRTVAMGARS
jgi:chromosome partitioning protein